MWKLGLFLLETTLTFCQVIILLYTMSQAHKVVHASLNSISSQHQAPAGSRIFNPGISGTGFCKIPGSRDYSGRD